MAVSLSGVVRGCTTYALREKVRELFLEAKLSRSHIKSLKMARQYAGADNLKLHLGCGPCLKPGWINIDLHSKNPDLRLDLRERWPFLDSSVVIVYSEHFFEHFEYPFEVRRFLSEAWRVLAPGGKFSVGVPDCEFSVKSYLSRDVEFHRREREMGLPDEVTTPMDHLNYTFRQGREHKYAYDFETLEKVLKEAQFISIVKRPFDVGLDSKHREWGTLYVDAIKPVGD